MTAKEFYKELEEKLLKKHSKREVIIMMMSDDWEFIFAEAYHQHRVNAISDEVIDNEFKYGFAHYYKEGIKWFKEQLLKQ